MNWDENIIKIWDSVSSLRESGFYIANKNGVGFYETTVGRGYKWKYATKEEVERYERTGNK